MVASNFTLAQSTQWTIMTMVCRPLHRSARWPTASCRNSHRFEYLAYSLKYTSIWLLHTFPSSSPSQTLLSLSETKWFELTCCDTEIDDSEIRLRAWASCMERDGPRSHTPIRTCARQSRRADPEHRIDPARPRVLHRDVPHRLVDAPHVDVRVE